MHVFLLGSYGIPASYGGFEAFVEQLTKGKKSVAIHYHVSCFAKDDLGEFEYNDAHCFNIRVPKCGAAKAFFYDVLSLRYCYRYIREQQLENAIVYMLGCGIGPVFGHYTRKLHRLGVKLFINPDGLEWKRDKWHPFIRKYLKWSEKLMVKHCDLAVCDSLNIEKYIKEEYEQFLPKTKFIAYGAEIQPSKLTAEDTKVSEWMGKNGLQEGEYYLSVGRFVPENNFRTMLEEFCRSNTKKSYVLITNVEQNSFYNSLKAETHFDSDPRVKFVGTVYDQELLSYIRQNAYGYIHGHEVGGTNPSLLESLANTKLNLLLGVDFNREVGADAGCYWSKEPGNLSELINNLDKLTAIDREAYGMKATKRITGYYNWDHIVDEYEKLLKDGLDGK